MLEYINEAEQYLLHTYNRFQVVFDHGDGVYLYDTDGKEYLDFVSGIGVFALGYNNKEFNDAVKAQVDKILHTSNYYYNVPAIEAAKAVLEASKMDKVFFTNSGAEAVEGALKVARKYAFNKDGQTDHEIIAMQHSFHGRTFGALSVTGTDKYRAPFGPMIGNIKFAEINDLDSVKALVSDKTCAIICETLQGEGGIRPATEEFLKGLRQICDETGALLILDEIQCGMGRTGYMYCWQKYGIKPDVMTTAKALGGGIPMGAFLMTKEVADNSLVAGDHGTTYGGNPLCGAACVEVFNQYKKLGICENAATVGAYLFEKLEEVKNTYGEIVDHRGMGLMQGLEFDKPVKDIINNALDNGLVLINAGEKIIRFLPPLVITKEDVDRMLVILKEAIENAH